MLIIRRSGWGHKPLIRKTEKGDINKADKLTKLNFHLPPLQGEGWGGVMLIYQEGWGGVILIVRRAGEGSC